MENTARLPLEGKRVVDFTRDYAGAYVPLWLSAMGAEVIKIESIINPDVTRRIGMEGEVDIAHSRSGYYNAVSFSKLGCTINLQHQEAAELVRQLVMVSDVVTESYATGVMERLGIGYRELRKWRPDLIFFSISGFGRSGPYADFKAYGHVASSFGGIDLLTGFPDKLPTSVGSTLDGLTSMSGVFAVLCALWEREATGQGQHIDLAMSEVQMSMIPHAVMEYVLNGRLLERQGNHHPWLAPHNCYPCQGTQEWIAIAARTDQEWQGLCTAMGRPGLASDSRFADGLQRWRNQDELDRLISAWTMQHSPDELTQLLQESGVPAGPVNTVESLSSSPQLQARHTFEGVNKPGLGSFSLPRLPGDVGETPQFHYAPAPFLGEHNAHIFTEVLGMPRSRYQELVEDRAIF